MKRLTARWVRKADADEEGARRLARARPPLPDLVCFHCQQAAEKYLKALAQELKNQGFHALVSENSSNGRPLWWVRAGPVAERARCP